MPFVNGAWVPEEDSVATQVAALTAQDSPLMRQAQTRGLQTANRRGLINSSLAGQAAQEAVISAATPIASADAATIASKNLAKINADYQSEQQKQAIAATDRQALLSAGVQSNNQYLDTFGQLAGNKDIPAATRDAYIANLANVRNSSATLARSIYGVDLAWG